MIIGARPQQDIRGILFDLDNTLYNRDLAFEGWTRSFVAEQFAAESDTGQDAIVQQILALDNHGYVTKHVLFTQLRALYPTIRQEVSTLCERFYQEWLVYMTLEAGTQSLLNALDLSAIPFGIITNGPVQQHLKIDQLELRSRTRCLFISEEFGCHKPDPAIFQAAAACLGLPCEQILFVGDNPHADICGAQAVGMTTAWLPCGTIWPSTITEVQPDYVVGCIADLAAILKLPV